MTNADPAGERGARLTRKLLTELSVGRWLAFSIGVLLIFAVLGIGLALAASSTP
jgi:hypothetical protein